MGTKTLPSRDVTVCDTCGRAETFLQGCWVCGRDFCLVCEGTVPQSYGFTAVCRDCARRDDVRDLCRRFAEKLAPIFKRRDEALKKLRKKKGGK